MLIWLLLVASVVGAWWIFAPVRQNIRRRRLHATPLSLAYIQMLTQRWPLYRRLPETLQQQLHAHIQVFLAEKTFTGCNGLIVSEEMRLLIAAQACLLLLNRHSSYYPQVAAILLYPHAFWVEHEARDEHGIHSQARRVLSGESWADSKVILSWEDVEHGLVDAEDEAHNVVLHEFAHQLDGANGSVNGAPLLRGGRPAHARWVKVMQVAYERHCARSQWGQPVGGLSAYGAEAPAEFFAVATEAFFLLPQKLRPVYPQLYEILADYYQLSPADWPLP
jgi:MtfA peptidase